MASSWWVAAGVGVVVAGLHAGLRALTRHWARQADPHRQFLAYEIGGMLGRMGIVLGGVALVLTLTPLPELPFLGGVAFVLVGGLAMDVVRALWALRAEDSAA